MILWRHSRVLSGRRIGWISYVRPILKLTAANTCGQYCDTFLEMEFRIRNSYPMDRIGCSYVASCKWGMTAHNCAIQGARLIWKQKIWLAICKLLCSLTNQNACFITLFWIQLPLFCTVLRKNCTVLSQSESSYFSCILLKPLIRRS